MLQEFDASTLQIKDFDLLVVFQSDYDPRSIESLYTRLDSTQIVLSAYVLAGELMIDNLYCPAWLSPCHFCNIAVMRASAVARLGSSKNSFLNFYDYLLKNKIPFPKALPVDELGEHLVHHAIGTHIKKLLIADEKHPFDPRLSTTIDLTYGDRSVDLALHSENCSCLSKGWDE